jgi:glucokinase
MTEPTHAIALDLGGTDLKFARIERDGSVHEWGRVSARAMDGAEVLLGVLAQAARPFAEGACAVGLGCPGVIDPRSGALVDVTPHLSLTRDFPLAERLGVLIGLPVYADNDANLAALGEARMGAARGARTSVTITVGTGVGCGIVVEGRVLRGAWGGAGEISHAGLGSSGPACECGVAGCLEPLSGGDGLARRALEAGLAASEARDVFDAAAAGNARAERLIAEMADALGRQIAVVVQVVNPEVVVVGGGVARAGDAWLAAVRAAVLRYAMPSHTRGLRIVPAALGTRAGVTGAGLFAWERVGWANG